MTLTTRVGLRTVLKPSSALVTVGDDHVMQQVIDFGVAKALTDRTHTEVASDAAEGTVAQAVIEHDRHNRRPEAKT